MFLDGLTILGILAVVAVVFVVRKLCNKPNCRT